MSDFYDIIFTCFFGVFFKCPSDESLENSKVSISSVASNLFRKVAFK